MTKESDQALHRRLNAKNKGKNKNNNNNNNNSNNSNNNSNRNNNSDNSNGKSSTNKRYDGYKPGEIQAEHFKYKKMLNDAQNQRPEERKKCVCLATKHGLIGNCLQCGRIVCEAEGAGVCLFCSVGYVGSVQTKTGKKREKQNNINQELNTEVSTAAIENKNRILAYDRESAQRTVVIDDENDYFETDSRWISGAEREKRITLENKMQQEREKAKRSNFITIDLVNGSVSREDGMKHFDESKFRPENQKAEKKKEITVEIKEDVYYRANTHPDLKNKPTFLQLAGMEKVIKPKTKLRSKHRVQDDNLSKMIDMGKCMSMHQPWASLLVYGIKTVEGRSWYSSHRGRLWIAATSQEPTLEEIQAVEDQYRQLYNDKDMWFPSSYPTSCLLGCVDVVDCMTNEDYLERYGSDESKSDYVFVCENTSVLPIRFSITGDHKIWNLTKETHQSAKNALLVDN